LTLPPKVVRDAWFGSESEKKPTTKRRNINPLYPPPDITKEEWAELEAEWGDPKDFKDDMSEAELELIRKKNIKSKNKTISRVHATLLQNLSKPKKKSRQQTKKRPH